jgi:polyribonucleotide nucleotidyltransferase
VVKPGDQIMVKVIEIDSQGRINLSRKAVLGGSAGDGAPQGGEGDEAVTSGARSNGRTGDGGSGGGGGERRPRRRRPTGGSAE